MAEVVMHRQWWLACTWVGLLASGCSFGDGEDTGLARLQLDVAQTDGATPSSEVAIVFNNGTPYLPTPIAAEVSGEEGGPFHVVLDPSGPPPELVLRRRTQSGTWSPPLAFGMFYQVVPGAIEANPVGVAALDLDVIVAHANGAVLMYFAEPMADVGDVFPAWQPAPVSAGWHLFMDGQEVPLNTPLLMGTQIEA